MLKEPIFVTGCPRSGTSLYCGCLARSGADGGKICGATSANPKGQYENSSIRNKLIKPYLRSINCDPLGQKPLPDLSKGLPPRPGLRPDFYGMLLDQGLQDDEIWYMKVCKAALIWPLFFEHFPDAKWVIVRRDKEDIVESCMRTSFMRKRRTRESWGKWVDHHVRCFEDMAKHMNTFEVWPTEMVNGDLSTIKDSIEWLGLKWNEDAILEWVDGTLWHGK